MHEKEEQLKELYKQMSELTLPQCRDICLRPLNCCSPEYCAMAIQIAAEKFNVILETTNHPTLPLMGIDPSGRITGCTAAPHFRPLCTLHTCEINSMGFTKDEKWDQQYFTIREAIEELEFELSRGRTV